MRRGPARADRSEEAGRATRENERRNTILCDERSLMKLKEVLEVVYVSRGLVRDPDAIWISGNLRMPFGVVYLLQ